MSKLKLRRWWHALRHPERHLLVYRGWWRWRLPTCREARDRGIDHLTHSRLARAWPA